LVQLLAGIGLDVRAVENGADAIAQWQEWHPHLIWLDWHASIINGADVTRKIRTLESLHQSKDIRVPAVATADLTQTIIIAVTANVFEDIHSEILQAGAEHFIRKPFSESEIFDLMATYLQIQYLYESPLQSPSALSAPMHPDDIEHHLSQMSSDWLSTLLQAAIELDEETTQQSIQALAQEHSILADQLTELCHTFQFGTIADLAHNVLTLRAS
jgi:two-component system, sensor histidine kinase and response regulator